MKMPEKREESGSFLQLMFGVFMLLFGISYFFNLGDNKNDTGPNYYENEPSYSTRHDGNRYEIYEPNSSNFNQRYEGKQKLTQSLRDPGSLEIIKESIVTKNGVPYYHATYRAKNGFGGYNVRDYQTRVNK